jgi:O-antigen/teichoic acid export membrane protein
MQSSGGAGGAGGIKPPGTSREAVVRNGTYLIARETIGLIVRSVGLVVLVREIGTTSYGLYSGPVVIIGFLAAVATFGSDLFLLRRAADNDRWFDVAYAWLLASSVSIAVVGIVVSQLLRPVFTDQRFVPVFQVLLLSLPVNILWVPAKCRLERSMAFARIAVVEVMGDITLYAVAIPLALAGFHQWAAVDGYIAWQTSLLITSMALAKKRPRLHWSMDMTKQMLGFGSAAAAGTILDRAREATVPLIVGRFGGAAGIGVVSLGMRLVDTMGFARRATWRLAVVALGWLHSDRARLKRALEESTALQVLALGPMLAVFSVASPWLVPRLFGSRWHELIYIFPFLALAQLSASLFTMHGSALLAMGNARAVAISNLTRIVIIAAVAPPLGWRYGITGASAAVGISILGFIPLHFSLRRFVHMSYAAAAPQLVMFVPLLWAPFLPHRLIPLLAIPLVACLALPGPRRQIVSQIGVVAGALLRRSRSASLSSVGQVVYRDVFIIRIGGDEELGPELELEPELELPVKPEPQSALELAPEPESESESEPAPEAGEADALSARGKDPVVAGGDRLGQVARLLFHSSEKSRDGSLSREKPRRSEGPRHRRER